MNVRLMLGTLVGMVAVLMAWLLMKGKGEKASTAWNGQLIAFPGRESKADASLAFASYILSRANGTLFDTDSLLDELEPIAKYLGVPLEIRTAKSDLHRAFPADMANAIEKILTGHPWTEADVGTITGGEL